MMLQFNLNVCFQFNFVPDQFAYSLGLCALATLKFAKEHGKNLTLENETLLHNVNSKMTSAF